MTKDRSNKKLSAERKEHKKLARLWLMGRATKKQIIRCLELDAKKAVARLKEARLGR